MILDDSDDGVSEGCYVVGVKIADISSEDGCMDENEIDLSDLMKECTKIKAKLNLKEEPILFTGTRSS